MTTKKTTVVWLPMNRQCTPKLPEVYRQLQPELIERANGAATQYLRRTGTPFWNLNALFPAAEVCNASSDGIHLKEWAVHILARVLLSQLCSQMQG